ncbi:hypothetical protein Poli38472_010396 [Pythium oligandrum]|uniref:Uncharacterized protein n=1 Tax=Pythium oligandrum TaxID=41045 RepID=A0A8K1FC61_PYTOL|nr:hypothetical protein Poli38472_010396 [Pythium oligandrum]|eukprot:TMW55514.1 hypothetical protein Poli38472_010396 [Pythium oligandrum]
MIQTGVLGILLYVALTLLVAWQCIAGQKPFDLVINGRRQGDAGDGLAFTTSTISVFLIKLAVVKRIRAAEKSMPGLVTVPCATIKSVLRLVPKATASSIDPSPPENLSLPRQRLRLREENQTMIDGRNTILPQKYWRWLLLHHRYFLCISLRVLGAFGFLFMWAQGLMNFRRMKAISLGKSVVPVTRPSLVAVFAVLFTSVHCGVYVLFYQRDLFRDLITRFDFLFTSVQLFTFSICMCDTQGWDSNSFSVLLTFLIWLHWTLTLDALTPNMKRLFGFSKRHATHVSASALFSCIGLLGVLFFTQTNPLRDRVLWSYPVSSTYTIKLRVQTILLGRIVTILLWCSRQTALLLVRKEDELQSIYGALHYDNPYESFPAPHKHAKRRVNVQFVGKEAQGRRIN